MATDQTPVVADTKSTTNQAAKLEATDSIAGAVLLLRYLPLTFSTGL